MIGQPVTGAFMDAGYNLTLLVCDTDAATRIFGPRFREIDTLSDGPLSSTNRLTNDSPFCTFGGKTGELFFPIESAFAMPSGSACKFLLNPLNTDGTQPRLGLGRTCFPPIGHPSAVSSNKLHHSQKEVIMRPTVQIFTLILAALIFSACQAPAPPTLSDADIAAIRTANASYASAAKARDWGALAALYAQDAIIMPPNHPSVTGRANIQVYFQAFPPMSAFEVPIVEIEGRSDLAVVRGTYSMTIIQEGSAPVTDSGKWMEMRRKQADGSWLIYCDIWNSDMAMPK